MNRYINLSEKQKTDYQRAKKRKEEKRTQKRTKEKT